MPPKKEGSKAAGGKKASGRSGGADTKKDTSSEQTEKTYSFTAVRCSECNGDLTPEKPAGSRPGTPIQLFCPDHGARTNEDEIIVTKVQFFSDSDVKVEMEDMQSAQAS